MSKSIDSKAKALRAFFAMVFVFFVVVIAAIPFVFDSPPDTVESIAIEAQEKIENTAEFSSLSEAEQNDLWIQSRTIEATNVSSPVLSDANQLWVLVSASLVFFMQAGFLCYEVGLARPVHASVVAIKNLVDWTISSIGFFLVGFGLMFGSSLEGLIGTDMFLLDGTFGRLIDNNADIFGDEISGGLFFLFQLAFAGTAITLVSGSLVERTTVLAYSVIAVALAVVIYPVYGHWVWGNFVNGDNGAWLAELGFHDFAGGTVVHLLGATAAFVGIAMIGPRIGRFGPGGEVREMAGTSVGMTMLGVLILWFGWWGFNGGSFLTFNGSALMGIIVTNLAAVSGLIGAGLFAYLFQHRYSLNMKLAGGAIGGLVAITPGADVVTPLGAIATGLIAGVIYSYGNDWLLKRGVDDALGVIPAHGFCAAFGTVSLAFFSGAGTLERSRMEQFGVQLLGVAVCVIWAAFTSYAVYWFIQRFFGLRVSPAEEMTGFSLETTQWPYKLTEETK